MKAKVVHLTSLHPALDSRIFYNQCRLLARNDFNVVLIAPGTEDFEKDGVRVETLPFAKSRWRRLFGMGWSIYRRALRHNADVYHFHDPEFMPWAALLRLSGHEVVMDIHEDQPGAMRHSRDEVPKALREPFAYFIDLIERCAAVFFSAVVTTTKSNALRFPSYKTFVVENFPEVSDGPVQSVPFRERGDYMVFSGTLGELQCIPELVDAMGELPASSKTKLRLAGKFVPPDLETELRKKKGWERVEFVGWQERQGVYQLLQGARAGFVLYKSPNASPEFSSRKLYEYMAFGIPLIVSSVKSWAEIVKNYQCGEVVEDATSGAIAEAIKRTLSSEQRLEQMSANAKAAYQKSMNSSVSMTQLLGAYDWILNPQ